MNPSGRVGSTGPRETREPRARGGDAGMEPRSYGRSRYVILCFLLRASRCTCPSLRCPRVSAVSLSLPMHIALSLCLPFRSAAWSYIPPAPPAPRPPIPHKGPVRLDLIMLRPPGKKKRPNCDSRRPVSFMLLNATFLLLPQEPARTVKTFARQCPPAEPLRGLDLDVEPGLAIPVLMSNPLPLSLHPAPQGHHGYIYIYIYLYFTRRRTCLRTRRTPRGRTSPKAPATP